VMLLLISPAKTLDFESPLPKVRPTQPSHLSDATRLVDVLRTRTPEELSKLMHVSAALGALNADRFGAWQTPFTPANARPALFAFKGDVYQGLQAGTLGSRDIQWAQRHLRILSGLYGLLRPLDLIQPYRLEMGTRLAFEGFRNLYGFWGARLTEAVNAELVRERRPVLLNLASQEYFGAIDSRSVAGRIVTPSFKELRNGRYQFLSMFGKRARGLMARHVIERRITTPEALQEFDLDGYRFAPEMSHGDDWVFVREAPR
jgi:cytoplasmic iron level regulating protein YaaA (DUF328/UPF0246 family)